MLRQKHRYDPTTQKCILICILKANSEVTIQSYAVTNHNNPKAERFIISITIRPPTDDQNCFVMATPLIKTGAPIRQYSFN